MRRVLITGGAGFIGSHLADELLRGGDSVRVLAFTTAQVAVRYDGSAYAARAVFVSGNYFNVLGTQVVVHE